MKKLRDFDVNGKRVLVRCDFNVPLDDKGNVLDDFRIRQTLPSIEYLIEKKAKIILMSHLGRPDGKEVQALRLNPVQNKLAELLSFSVAKAQNCIGPEIVKRTKEMRPGEILLLENLRFYKEEEENDENFAGELAKLGDFYINEAFGASHRAHASIVGLQKYLPSAAGFLLEKEIMVLTDLTQKPAKPLVAIIGGKKVETKTKVIDRISEKGDWVLVGGLIKKEIREKNIQLKHPRKIVEPVDEIEGKDIGPKTVELFKEKIALAKTVFWSGPVGLIEEEKFSKGSQAVASAIVEAGAFSVAGGGETIEFINKSGFAERFNHLSTGGGAMLEFLSGEHLPGLKALE